jgi:hypothetical protein
MVYGFDQKTSSAPEEVPLNMWGSYLASMGIYDCSVISFYHFLRLMLDWETPSAPSYKKIGSLEYLRLLSDLDLVEFWVLTAVGLN